MVKRMLMNLLLEQGARVGKSFQNAYAKVINCKLTDSLYQYNFVSANHTCSYQAR